MTSTSASSMGTPLYMSPEQWMSSAKVDWRADAYSLGCVLFEMITGRVPFTGESIGQLCAHHLHSPPPRAGEIVPVPPALDALVTRLLAKAPDERPGSMREIASVFTSLDGAAPSAAYSTPMSAPYSAAMAAAASSGAGANTTLGAAASSISPVPPRKSRVLPILGGVVVAAGLGVGVFTLLGNSSKSTSPAPTVATTEPPAATPPPPPVPDAAVAAAVVPADAAAVEAPVEPAPVEKKPVVPTKKPAAKPLPKPPALPDPNLPEKITRKMIKSMISSLRDPVGACHAKRGGGPLLLQASVNPDGSLGDVAFLRTPDVEVSKCVLAKLREHATFPRTKTGGTWKAQFMIAGG
jgi:serine/threonine-protein kinase